MKITEEIQECLDRIRKFSGNDGIGVVCFVSDEDEYSVVIGGERSLMIAALASEARRNPDFKILLESVRSVLEKCEKGDGNTLKS